MCSVASPDAVTELDGMAQYQDSHGAAAVTVLAVRDHDTVEDPSDRTETPEERPTVWLDDGETDAIVLANTLDIDGVLTDEFAGTTVALVHAALQGSPTMNPTAPP